MLFYSCVAVCPLLKKCRSPGRLHLRSRAPRFLQVLFRKAQDVLRATGQVSHVLRLPFVSLPVAVVKYLTEVTAEVQSATVASQRGCAHAGAQPAFSFSFGPEWPVCHSHSACAHSAQLMQSKSPPYLLRGPLPGAGEMARWWRALVAPAEDPQLLFPAPTWRLVTISHQFQGIRHPLLASTGTQHAYSVHPYMKVKQSRH